MNKETYFNKDLSGMNYVVIGNKDGIKRIVSTTGFYREIVHDRYLQAVHDRYLQCQFADKGKYEFVHESRLAKPNSIL